MIFSAVTRNVCGAAKTIWPQDLSSSAFWMASVSNVLPSPTALYGEAVTSHESPDMLTEMYLPERILDDEAVTEAVTDKARNRAYRHNMLGTRVDSAISTREISLPLQYEYATCKP